MTLEYKLSYTNHFTYRINPFKRMTKEINILGDCKITNYDTRVEDGKKNGHISIDFSNNETIIKEGLGEKLSEKRIEADFSAKKFEIFKKVANLDDSAELSVNDIKKMDKSLIQKWGLKDLRFDYKNGVATLIWGENDILRIDFSSRKKEESEDKIKDTKAFLEALGGQETKGKKKPYFCMNQYGYVGKYQMGEQAMAEMGIYKKKVNPKTKKVNYNNDWSGIFVKNKYGINTLWDYRNSPEKQELLQIDYKKNDWKYIKRLKLDKYLGMTINGIEITASGLLAGAHLVGVGDLRNYLESNGKDDVSDRTGTRVSKYIKDFAGYDVEEIIRG